jgi:carbamate kinase
MGPKIEAATTFVANGGKFAGIGKLEDALTVLEGKAGTIVAAS